jgi:hypothetical protein
VKCAAHVHGLFSKTRPLKGCFSQASVQNTTAETGSNPMYRARTAARSGESKADSFRGKSLWSPGVPNTGPNSPDTSKARFGYDICEFESSQPSHAVRSPSSWDRRANGSRGINLDQFLKGDADYRVLDVRVPRMGKSIGSLRLRCEHSSGLSNFLPIV